MSESTRKFDLIVIGGGPAGVVGATTAASMGKKVALVESRAEPAVQARIRGRSLVRRCAKLHLPCRVCGPGVSTG